MTEDYNEWIDYAYEHNILLRKAIEEKNLRDIIYYRGKYIHDLKQAYKLNHEGFVPAEVCGSTHDMSLVDEIKNELQLHQMAIDDSIEQTKESTNIKKSTIPQEIALKYRKVATRASQVKYQTGEADAGNVAIDSVSFLTTTAVKAPVMVTSKVLSKIGPLAVTIACLPFTAFASMMAFICESTDPKKKTNNYTNTPVHQLSNELKKAVKNIFKSTYENVGKM